MTRTASFPDAQLPRRGAAARTISALMLREMSTTHGRAALGYVWAVLEPVGGIMLMTLIFSVVFRAPGIGTSFPLFYATGILPFIAYADIAQKISVALRFSRQLLFYPGVTFMDALLARFIVNAITQVLIGLVVLSAILALFGLDVILDPAAIALGFAMALALGLGIGTLNCLLLSLFPVWERTWAILNRPLFILSCTFFLYDSVPRPFQGYLWWNPLVHVIGQVRRGVYATYEGAYVSHSYVFLVAGTCLALGLLLLRRHHRHIVNN